MMMKDEEGESSSLKSKNKRKNSLNNVSMNSDLGISSNRRLNITKKLKKPGSRRRRLQKGGPRKGMIRVKNRDSSRSRGNSRSRSRARD